MTPAVAAYLGLVAVTSAVCFAAYGLDKRRAGGTGRRVPERTLHLLALAGGWPGALAGQRHFRHKTRKVPFLLVFWATVVVHVAVVGSVAYAGVGYLLTGPNAGATPDRRRRTRTGVRRVKLLRTHHVAVICSDYGRSKQFYTEVLGLEVVAEVYRAGRDSHKLDLRLPDGTQVELFSFPNPPGRPSYPEACGLRHLAFEVEDIGAAVAHLEGLGVAVEPVRVDEYTGKRFTFFADPDGLPLELYER